jgi:hypothetical protein
MMKISQNLIVTVGEDSYMRVWNDRGNLAAALQLNSTSPDLWRLKINTFGHRERIYAQAEAILKNIHSREEAENSRDERTDSVVNVKELMDFRCSSSGIKKRIRKTNRKKAYVSLREMDIKRKAIDSFKQLFNTEKYDDKNQDYCMSPLGSGSDNETAREPATKAAKQLNHKLKQIELSKEGSKLDLHKKSDQATQEAIKKQREEKRKNFPETSRSRSVPLLKHKKVIPSIQPAKGFCAPLVRELNEEVKRAKNNQGISDYVTSSRSLVRPDSRLKAPVSHKLASSVSKLPGITPESATSVLLRIMQDRSLPISGRRVMKSSVEPRMKHKSLL